ncbi:class I SAM-dependent methyltransferase [Lysobacter niastensis]|nr:class I SAM-dependent methyltransferase [Lysobacter niastensis]
MNPAPTLGSRRSTVTPAQSGLSSFAIPSRPLICAMACWASMSTGASMAVKRLSDAQLEAFDTEHVSPALWDMLVRRIDAQFPHGRLRFLDVGGGSGRFADRLLARYPHAHGVVLDNSRLLLARNKPHARKFLIEESAENIGLLDGGYDLVFFNWVLHHLVGFDYRESVENVVRTVHDAAYLLSDRGHISIFENVYDGLLVANAPSHIIFRLTSANAIAPLIHRLGANTARIGVCFQSKRAWERILHEAGMATVGFDEDEHKPVPWPWKAFLHVGNLRCGLFWGTSVLNQSLPKYRLATTLDSLERH